MTLFYQLQGQHHGKQAATGTRQDQDRMQALLLWESDDAFGAAQTVREVVCWFWKSANADYWRDRISTVTAFVNAFPTLECQLLGTVPAWWQPSQQPAVPLRAEPPTGARNIEAAEIDRVHAAAMELAEMDAKVDEAFSMTSDEARASAREALERARLPERKDVDR